MDEVFGPENFCQIIPFRKKLMPLGAKLLEGMFDYLLWFSKNVEFVKFRHLYKILEAKYASRWTNVQLHGGQRRKLTRSEVDNPSLLPPDAILYRLVSQRAPSFSEKNVYEFEFKSRRFLPPTAGCWVTSANSMERLKYAERLEAEGDN